MHHVNRLSVISTAILVLIVSAGPLHARQAGGNASSVADIEAIHDELRALKRAAEAAFNALGDTGDEQDLDTLLGYVHDDAVLIGMNGRIVTGKDGIREEFVRTLGGSAPTLASIHHTFDVAALSTLYGDDTAVAYGTSAGAYELTDGMSLDVDTYWTATMVKEDGQWLLASFQFAPSIFDNPVLDKAVGMVYRVAAVTALVGLIVGFLLARIFARKR